MKIENKTVVAATASKTVVTLYFTDGSDLKLPADQAFTTKVIDMVTPALHRGETITLNMEDKQINIFQTMEEKSGGLVKFFRVAKKALGLGGDNPTRTHIESIALPLGEYILDNKDETIVAIISEDGVTAEPVKEPVNAPEPAIREEAPQAVQTKATPATKVDDTRSNASVPAKSTGKSSGSGGIYTSRPTNTTETILVGSEKLRNQINHFSKAKNSKGFLNFMRRMGEVAKTRKHTAEELLTFLDTADLPIADDGCIIAYKRLRTSDNNDYLVDSHSGTVKQKVGTRVFMAPEKVDPNRANLCSHGLHIGRRDYMPNFSGNAIIICKIAPEDVIAVPMDYNGSKMRCAGYHIVYKLSHNAFNLVSRGQPMTNDEETAKALTRIIAGDHVGVLETTEILAYREIKITNLNKKYDDNTDTSTIAPTKALENVTKLQETIDPSVNSPKAIKEKIKAAKEKPAELVKAEETGDPRKVKRAKRKVSTKAPEKAPETKPEPVKAKTPAKPKAKAPAKKAAAKAPKVDPVDDMLNDMTEHQKLAKARWHEIAEGKISKVKLAKECRTSTRSLDRWAEKFNF